MYATHDSVFKAEHPSSRLTSPRIPLRGRDLRFHAGRPLRRALLHGGRFFPTLWFERTSDTPSPRGHSLEHRAQPRRTSTRCPAIGPLAMRPKPRRTGRTRWSRRLPQPRVNVVEIGTPEVPSTPVPFPPTDGSAGAVDPVVRKRTQHVDGFESFCSVNRPRAHPRAFALLPVPDPAGPFSARSLHAHPPGEPDVVS